MLGLWRNMLHDYLCAADEDKEDVIAMMQLKQELR